MKYFRFYKNEIFSGIVENLFTSTEIFSGTGEMQKWSCRVPECPFLYLSHTLYTVMMVEFLT